jgi:hypothetical protein
MERKFTAAIERLIVKLAKQHKVNTNENIELIKEMVYTGIQNDFMPKGAKKIEAEKRFEITTDLYYIKGFIDKTVYEADDSIRIYDYKTSKNKFTKEELEYNLQSLIYSLAIYKLTKKIPEVIFVFLRFPSSPIQKVVRFTVKQLKGFELYLEQVSKFLHNFGMKQAKESLACHSEATKWLCGREGLKKNGDKQFMCPFRKPLEYFAILDKDNEIIRSDFDKDKLKPEKDQKVIKLHYSGCPFYNSATSDKDPFDF